MSNLIAVSDMQVMADAIVKSGFYGFKTKEQVMAVMLVAQAEQKHPASVVQEYDIIQNRPALKSQAMLARFQLAGGKVEWHELTPTSVSGTFSHPQGGSLKVEWNIQMAKQAGLYREGSGWTKYPEDMLRSRCISRGVRSVFPACILGHYAVEEVIDFEPRQPVVKDMGQAEVVNPSTGEIQAPVEVVLKAFYLHVPGNPEPFNSYDTPEEWIVGYAKLVQRITMSEKLSEEQKQDKLKSLAEVNKEVTAKFDSFQKAKLRTAIIQNGGTSNPKPETSPSSTALELSDSEF